METFYQILAIIAAGLLVYFSYKTIKGNPTAFSRENLSKSLSSVGVLAIILIIFVTFLVLLLRYS
jgi:hypothetical protein